MGDPRRFHYMADLVARAIPTDAVIADVAAGKGYLRAALYERGYRRVTSWDKVRRCATPRSGYRYGHFNYLSAPLYEAVVAMHPDGGTDHALLYALERGVPGLICPCCITPSAVAYFGVHRYDDWCAHLDRLAAGAARWTSLPISGRVIDACTAHRVA